MQKQVISSRQNPLVKLICGLADKKKRAQSGLFRFDGIKLLSEALSSGIQIEYVICREGEDALDALLADAVSSGRLEEKNIIEVSESVFEKLSEEKAPEGVITVAHICEDIHMRADALPEGKILICESLRDPGNLGTVMRSAYALGIDTLILTDDCADIYNPRTLRAAMGTVFKQRTQTVSCSSLAEFISRLRKSGRRVYATALTESSRDIGTLCLSAGDCFVIGNEGHGLSCEAIAACDASVIIPMREDAESLNAAAAAAICIWETVNAEVHK